MSDQVVFAGARDLVPCVVISCLNLIVALTLVAISLFLVMAVSAIACFFDRPKRLQPIRCRIE